MNMPPSIYTFIKQQESAFDTDEIMVGDNWYWNFRKHVQLIFHLKNGVFFTGENDWLRPFRNIMEPILNLAYWTEDIEVKDIVFYIESSNGKELSFLIKKYHEEVYVKEHDIDKMLDDIAESDIDYGGVLVQKGLKNPEIIPLNSIAFCDQTDILASPIGLKFNFSPAKLRDMEKAGWGKESNGATCSIDDLIMLATHEKQAVGVQSKRQNKVPGKTIEVYIVRGDMPSHYLNDDNNMEDYYPQVQIVAFYKNDKDLLEGVTLYRKKDTDELRFFTSREVFGRALGRGTGESMLHPQIWSNFLTIHKTNLLEAGSKVILESDDPDLASKSGAIRDMDNLEILSLGEGKRIGQVPTIGVANIQLYTSDIDRWFEFAKYGGSAFDPLLGKEQVSGTTFRGQERVVAQGQGLHNFRKGKRAKFVEELYREYIIPDMVKEILKGKEFLATLDNDELSWVVDKVVDYEMNSMMTDMVLGGQNVPSPEERDMIRQQFKQTLLKKGNKHLLKILKDEFKDIEVKIGINVANKQKDLPQLSDKILSIFQFVLQNPQGFQQAMQIPVLAKSFENILEYSGLSIANFQSLVSNTQAMNQQAPQNIPQNNQLMPNNVATGTR